ncbi:MAG TPA: hypothetical protein VJ436_08345, partial [Anaerolineales bacterium]|nr:hypothetical protein [Anaerolineales bacterium]
MNADNQPDLTGGLEAGILPAIIVAAYNRPKALERLLASLANAQYPPGLSIPLHITIDRDGDPNVLRIADAFHWEFGEKHVVYQPEHLGLLKHFYVCGELTERYGAIILLEDDLAVSPAFYAYTSKALSFYAEEPRIAGISLYALWFNGYTHFPFVPLPDDSDVFFLQIPYTQGQAFTRTQWRRFSTWLAAADRRLSPADLIHPMFLHFDAEEWFPIRTKYLVESQSFYVFPRESLTTGYGDTGAHFTTASSYFQTPLQRFKTSHRLKPLEASLAVYDSFFEILPECLERLTSRLNDFVYQVDLYGEKPGCLLRRIHHDGYVLTSKPCRAPLLSFGKQTWPIETNVVDGIPGSEISLCRLADIKEGWLPRLVVEQSNHAYFSR